MPEVKDRNMEIIGLVYSASGYRFELMDIDTGEKFRWLPTDAIKSLKGFQFHGAWSTYTRSGVQIAKAVLG